MEKIINSKEEKIFLDSLKDIVNSARRFAYNSINLAQLRQNWLIGQNLVIQEQKGKSRAEYGKHIVEIASKELTKEYGKGFSERNLWKFKQFYLTFKDLHILPTCRQNQPHCFLDNPTIGILLCTETDKTIARYSVLNDNKQLFASQYMNYLPSEEELKQVIEQQKEIFLSMKNK